jgi:hypothetical protein
MPFGSSQWMYSSGFYPTVIDQSLMFDGTSYLSRTPIVAGNLTTWTWSSWVKRGALSGSGTYALFSGGGGPSITTNWIGFVNDKLAFVFADGTYDLQSTAVYRDPSAFYHIVAVYDSGNATSSNRMKLYVNGVQITSFSTSTYVTQNYDSYINGANGNYLGLRASYGDLHYNGYLADTYFVDGTALDPTSFGEFKSGVWIPKAYTGSYGTNGFHLEYDGNANDSSGTGNNWTATNIVAGDYMLDSPTNNYATLNPLENTGVVLTNGNLDASYTTSAWKNVKSTFSMPSGKWYFEFVHTTSVQFTQVGVFKTSTALSTATYFAVSSDGWSYSANYGELRNNDAVITSGISTATTSDTINVAVDIDAGKLWFGKNGTWFNSGNPATGADAAYTNLSGAMSIAIAQYNSGGNAVVSLNAGQRPFAYTPPDGFLALSTANLPEPSIVDGSEYFTSYLNTGNGTARSDVISFAPDFVWTKSRSATGFNIIQDTVRGAGNRLITDGTYAEAYSATYGSFQTDGFDFGSDSNVNTNGVSYVDWFWKAGGTAVSNTDGTITSQVSANVDAGFSIVSWTGNGTAGATVGHGLDVAPKMVIVKSRSAVESWGVYNASLPSAAYYVILNTLAAQDGTGGSLWNSTAPSSTVLTLGTSTYSNANTATFIAYCFADVEGYSKFGSYTGNGSADGTFVYTGFRPAFVMVKRYTDTGNWQMFDSSRDLYNPEDGRLYANLSDSENDQASIDFVSNGFKLRDTSGDNNSSGQSYIYMAFAENPFKYANAR